jgi:hypothetical protein
MHQNRNNHWYYLKLRIKNLPERTEDQRLIKHALIALIDLNVGEEE